MHYTLLFMHLWIFIYLYLFFFVSYLLNFTSHSRNCISMKAKLKRDIKTGILIRAISCADRQSSDEGSGVCESENQGLNLWHVVCKPLKHTHWLLPEEHLSLCQLTHSPLVSVHTHKHTHTGERSAEAQLTHPRTLKYINIKRLYFHSNQAKPVGLSIHLTDSN